MPVTTPRLRFMMMAKRDTNVGLGLKWGNSTLASGDIVLGRKHDHE